MKRTLLAAAAAFAIGGAAYAQEPAPSTRSQAPAVRPPERGWWRPNDFAYRQMDMMRQNVGANGRKNATRDEQEYGERPSSYGFQQRPLGDW